MKNIMGIIYTGERDDQLRELTANRAVAAVPIAGRYRLIDFPLSAMVNSGIRNVGVIAQKNYNSLMDHLGSGREWDLHGKRSGLVFLPPFLTKENVGVYSGFLDALHSNLHYLRRSKERYVVITDTHMLFNARFDDMVAAHEASGADITLMYTRDPGVRRNGLGRYLNVEAGGKVTGMEIDPTIPRLPCTYLETLCVRRELLISLVDQSVSRGEYHLTRGLLMSAIYDGSLNIRGYENPGRAWQLDSVQSYFDCSMDLLNSEVHHRGHGGKQHPFPRRPGWKGRQGAELHRHAGWHHRSQRRDPALHPGQADHHPEAYPSDRPAHLSHRAGQGSDHLIQKRGKGKRRAFCCLSFPSSL